MAWMRAKPPASSWSCRRASCTAVPASASDVATIVLHVRDFQGVPPTSSRTHNAARQRFTATSGAWISCGPPGAPGSTPSTAD